MKSSVREKSLAALLSFGQLNRALANVTAPAVRLTDSVLCELKRAYAY